MQKSIIVRKYRGGVSTSKVLQGFEPISHCGVPVILRVENPKNLKKLLCAYKNEATVNNLDCFAIARNDAKRQRVGEPVILRGEHPEESHVKRESSAFSLRMTNRKKKAAFTLAEVLITLGIIGVIAAMTLPSLINTYRKLDTSAKLKKFFSSMNQAVVFSVAENGAPVNWIETLTYHDPESLYDWFDRYIMKHMRILKNCRNAGSNCVGEYVYCDYPGRCYGSSYISRNAVLYIFNDGSMITSLTGGGVDEETGMATSMTLHVRFDTNGYGRPNTYGQDVFSFRMNINEKFAYITCDTHKNLTGGSVSLKSNRDTLLQACKTDPQTCGCLLMYDNWEFKKDYPWL